MDPLGRGRPKAPLKLTDGERETLSHWATRPSAPPPLALRGRILLACALGASNKDVAREFRISSQTVGKWRARFLARRLDGLLDEPRTGAPRRILDADVERVLALTLESSAPGGRAWTTRSLAQASGLSQSAISRIWRAHGVRPSHGESARFLHDPRFVAQVRDVVGLYADPPTLALALCVAAHSVPSLQRVQLTSGPGVEPGPEENRAGPASLLSRLRLPLGRLRSLAERRERTHQFRRFLEALDATVPRGLDVHVLLARDGSHETSIVQSWLAGRPRFQLHPIAPRTSFDRLVERWLSILSKRWNDEEDPDAARRPLEAAVVRHALEFQGKPAPFVWLKASEQIASHALDADDLPPYERRPD